MVSTAGAHLRYASWTKALVAEIKEAAKSHHLQLGLKEATDIAVDHLEYICTWK